VANVAFIPPSATAIDAPWPPEWIRGCKTTHVVFLDVRMPDTNMRTIIEDLTLPCDKLSFTLLWFHQTPTQVNIYTFSQSDAMVEDAKCHYKSIISDESGEGEAKINFNLGPMNPKFMVSFFVLFLPVTVDLEGGYKTTLCYLHHC